jgi:peptidoglycan/xylan/chitin deacetylase (PgdA/CDA1 family)
LQAAVATAPAVLSTVARGADNGKRKAQIAITLDLEMSRHYPRRGMTEWDYQKGNLDEATKRHSVEAAKIASDRGAVIHFFCVGRVLEQADVSWLKQINELGHPIGNHTYDHVYVLAQKAEDIQFRFRRAPWLIRGRSIEQVLRENIRLTTVGLKQRAGVEVNGFRTPGGFANGLVGRPDVQNLLLDLGFTWISGKYPRHKTGPPKTEPTDEVYADIVRAQKEAQPFVYPTGLVEIPMSPISDVNAFRTNYWKLDYFLKAIGMSVQWAIDNGGVYDFLCHPSCMVVEDPEFKTIKMICDLVKQNPDRAEIVGLDKIAHRVAK